MISHRWIRWFTDLGRPLAVVLVMVLCAPGEQHLAELAGWSGFLPWLMAGLLVMYAGIAAVVATVRPRGAPGKKSAVVGAVLALALAAGAQPLSHLFVTGWLSAEPRPPVWLVVSVSSVPPLILGHLLHLAASPADVVEEAEDPLGTDSRPCTDAEEGIGHVPHGWRLIDEEGSTPHLCPGYEEPDDYPGDSARWTPDQDAGEYASPLQELSVPETPFPDDPPLSAVAPPLSVRARIRNLLEDDSRMTNDVLVERIHRTTPATKRETIRRTAHELRKKMGVDG